ncbi:MAG: hypothetical protein U5K54_16650 [Cytophagales bacterium]|nr:hypothetical protein [Cytophagales bacterium]
MFPNKAFSAINIYRFQPMGFTGALLLSIWIAQELSFEQYHADKDRLDMGWNRSLENGQLVCWETTPQVLAPTLMEEYASIESAASYAKWGVSHLFTVGDTRLLKTSGVFADASLLNILSFNFLKGIHKKHLLIRAQLSLRKSLRDNSLGRKKLLVKQFLLVKKVTNLILL